MFDYLPELSTIISFLSASIILTLAPGPDIIYVASQSALNGAKYGIITALGLSTGLVVHTLLASFGISALITASNSAYLVLKITGALYLFYLGIITLVKIKESRNSISKVQKIGYNNLFIRGIMMNLLNPKVILFFLAFLPQFTGKSSEFMPKNLVFLGILFIIQAITIFTLVSIISDKLGEKFFSSQTFDKYGNYATAIIFILIGISILL